MAFNMHNRNLLSLMHHSTRELRYLLDLSRDLKRAKYTGTEQRHLQRKNIALIFEKTSTRTRCAFEVAAYDQGANVTYIDPNSSQIGHKESMKDTARVLGRMYDAIEYRGFHQEIVEELAQHAGEILTSHERVRLNFKRALKQRDRGLWVVGHRAEDPEHVDELRVLSRPFEAFAQDLFRSAEVILLIEQELGEVLARVEASGLPVDRAPQLALVALTIAAQERCPGQG